MRYLDTSTIRVKSSSLIYSYPEITASIPASCGELMQGVLDGQDFLINSPITMRAKVRVSVEEGCGARVTTPGNFSKLGKVVSRVLSLLGPRAGANIEVLSAIPRGKGMASSTAELAAGLYGAAELYGVETPEQRVSQIIIETDHSTDAVYLPGITMINHLSGTVIARFGPPPPLSFIIVDTGGEVETSGFDRDRARQVAKKHQLELKQGLKLLKSGFRQGDSRLIAIGATISAIVNQEVLYKAELNTLLEGTAAYGALGVNCAHTGTVLGVMFDPRTTNQQLLRKRITALIGEKAILGSFSLISGGVNLESDGCCEEGNCKNESCTEADCTNTNRPHGESEKCCEAGICRESRCEGNTSTKKHQ